MLAATYLAAHCIWLHSPKCGPGAAEPNYSRDRLGGAGTRIASIATVIGSLPGINALSVATFGSNCSPTSHSMPAKLCRRDAARSIPSLLAPSEQEVGVAMPRSNSPRSQRDHSQLLDVPAVARWVEHRVRARNFAPVPGTASR